MVRERVDHCLAGPTFSSWYIHLFLLSLLLQSCSWRIHDYLLLSGLDG
jgi:hypothetical protein